MPLSRITLQAGKPEAYLQQVSDALHLALVECFEVPAADRFQIIEELPTGRLICDPHYLAGGERSADGLVFQIIAGRERSDACREAFFARLCSELQQRLGQRPEDVMVIITTNCGSEWSFSHGLSLPVMQARQNRECVS